MSKTDYNREYFEKRDHLDLHIAESLKIFMRDNKLKKVLDVGCGTGRLVEFLNKNGFEAVGCDNAQKAVEMARKRNKEDTIVKASATKLPFKKQAFGLVCAISVIEHLTEKQANKFIAEAKRVLKPNGFIFLITPNFSSPFRLIRGKKWFGYSDPIHKTFFTPKTLSRLLKSYRFKNITLRFKIGKNVKFDWHLPEFFRKLPSPVKHFLTYLMISSPLSTLRDSFWIAAQKGPAA